MLRFIKTLLLCAALNTAPSMAEWHYAERAIMGTQVRLQLWHEDSAEAEHLIEAVMAEFRRLDNQLSPYKENSELSLVNRQAGQGNVNISDELTRLIDKSLWFSQITNGAFDISYATLGKHYDFRNKKRAHGDLTDSLLEALNYRHLKLNRKSNSLRFSHSQTKIDLGGIAKGYAVDRAIAILEQAEICCASVSAGGDARMLGDKRGQPWLVGIRHPREKSKNAAVIPLRDIAISTSGDYERYFIDEQQERVHHIFNPSTGKPSETTEGDTDKLISVSIIGPHGFDTDPLSTSVFVLGKEKGLALINRLPQFEAVVIDSNRHLFFSRGLENL
ncbi:FAD:protein FMN transferase [Microbulbifer sp. OS29]|uniref:FAD:protein FMN transferase n=1 Tax=Microbulbifer okhotskensis TaxID=2926617 RepID=A0A9X2EIB7_9GAMM|nr:FAD:protein FMN transferase [Microbulbifer okhotskensis]MCO1332767.1 FAD:protein FMN transferase [Microbulbifer okhotskensis]